MQDESPSHVEKQANHNREDELQSHAKEKANHISKTQGVSTSRNHQREIQGE